MKKIFLDDTIAAISTPIGKSGIGIVRLSGKKAIAIAEKIFVGSDGRRPSQFLSHTLNYGWIVNKSEYIDEVLLAVMRAPRTYTKEDIVEINCHSGVIILRRILELLLKLGARLATAGEFTKRAYLNGRIDLAQAEAVLDVINAQTQDALNAALRQLQGQLSRHTEVLRKDLLDVLMHLEVSIDFSDQQIEPLPYRELFKKMEKVAKDVKGLLDNADKGLMLREGISCVICGKTNVGKSCLLNALLKKDRAIVTPIAGTTRDSLEEVIDLFGIPLRLIDTAGIIKARNLAEEEAVKRSRQHLKEANLILLVLDSSQKLTAADLAIARDIAQSPVLIVLNKRDLPQKLSLDQVHQLLVGKTVVPVSALRGTGLNKLEREIAECIWQGKSTSAAEVLITNTRHRESLRQAQKFLKRAIKAEKESQGAEVIALDVKEAQKSLGEIIGEVSSEDVLERIFSQFCIGK